MVCLLHQSSAWIALRPLYLSERTLLKRITNFCYVREETRWNLFYVGLGRRDPYMLFCLLTEAGIFMRPICVTKWIFPGEGGGDRRLKLPTGCSVQSVFYDNNLASS